MVCERRYRFSPKCRSVATLRPVADRHPGGAAKSAAYRRIMQRKPGVANVGAHRADDRMHRCCATSAHDARARHAFGVGAEAADIADQAMIHRLAARVELAVPVADLAPLRARGVVW
jgi:hypothetical protein